MKNSLLITAFLISSALIAQTKVTVNVANFSFTPASLIITVGDTVEFINASGTHWVDGRQVTYASNPVSFDNQSQSGTGWTYPQVFNTAGSYDYRCGIHGLNMAGTITVQLATGISNQVKENKVDFYPNPASKELNFTKYKSIKTLAVYSLTGEKVLESKLIKDKLDISSLSSGVYFVKVTTDKETTTEKLIIQ